MSTPHRHAAWTWTARGGAALLAGLVLLVWPAPTAAQLPALFGAFAVVDAAVALIGAAGAHRRSRERALALLEAAVGLGLGLGVLALPGPWRPSLASVMAGWVVATGALALVQVVRSCRDVASVGAQAAAATALVVFGMGLARAAPDDARLVAWLFACSCVWRGATMLTLGRRLRHYQGPPGPQHFVGHPELLPK